MNFNVPYQRKLALSLFLGALLALETANVYANQQIEQYVVDGSTIPKFVDPLPTFYGKRADGRRSLKIYAEEFQQKILPESFYKTLPSSVDYKNCETGEKLFTINPRKGTYVWGYKINDGKRVLGPNVPCNTIEVRRGTKTKVHYINNLKRFKDKKGRRLKGPLLQKFLTVDTSFQWANPLNGPQFLQGFDTYDPIVYPYGTGLPQGNTYIYEGPQPMVVHLHGSETPSYSDGDPVSWFTPHSKITGPGYVSTHYQYPNTQPATTLWFHDHVFGETRLNIYSGQAGFYLIRGEPETSVSPPLPRDEYEVELVLFDRQFDTNGQLFFPDGNPLTAGLNGPPGNPEINPYGIPEFFGDVICVNGKSWPYLEVEPRRYRFRFLDASSARMYALFLTNGGSTTNVPDIWQIGTGGGLLDYPVNMSIDENIPFTYAPSGSCDPCCQSLGPVITSPRLFFAPAERMDVIIDFSGFEGQYITVNNDSPAPFPGGGTELDPDDEGLVMQFRVTKPLSSPDTSFNPAAPDAVLRTGENAIVRLVTADGYPAPGVVPNLVRDLVLIEQEDPYSTAPVVVMLNNTTYDGRNPYNNEVVPDSVSYNKGAVYVTELPQVGSTELWEIINMTPDAHPIHIHLIQFQIMNRQPFLLGNYVPPFVCPGTYRNDYEDLWANYMPSIPPNLPPGTVYQYGPPLPYLSTLDSTTKIGGNIDVDQDVYLNYPACAYREPGSCDVGSGPFDPTVMQMVPVDANEYGWKDVVIAYPGTVTRLMIRWSPQTPPVGGVSPGENLFAFDPTAKIGVKNDGFGYPGGGGYTWHCHISDHEDNMMMRPFMVNNIAQVPQPYGERVEE